MPDHADRGRGGARGDPRPRKRTDLGLTAAGEPRLSTRGLAPLAVGAVLAALLVLVFPGGLHPVTLASALGLALAGLVAGLLRPSPATIALAAAAPVLAGLPRAWGETGPVPLLPLVAVTLLSGVLARRRRDGEPSALPAAVARWGGAFLVVAAASALASTLRGETLYLLLRGGASPLVVNSLGMTAGERTREAVVLLTVFAVLWASLDAFSALAREDGGRSRLAVALASGLASASVLVLLERVLPFALTSSYWTRIGRLSGLSTDPNALGIAVSLGVPLLLALLLARPGRLSAGAAGVGLLLVFPVLERSGSRTGLLLLGVAAVAAGIGRVRAGGTARRLALATAATAAVLLSAVVALAPRGGRTAEGGLLARLGSSLSAPGEVLFSSHRPLFWGAAFDMLAEEPLSGVGLGGFPFEFPAVFEKRAAAPAVATDNATNLVLDVAAECGLPALFLALGAVVPLLSRAAEAAFDGNAGDPLGRAAGAALAGFAVASLTGSHLRFPEIAILLSGVAALLPAAGAERPTDGWSRPKRVLPLLVASGVLASLLATSATARPEAAFPEERWAGLHDRGRPRRWTSENAFRKVVKGERRVVLTLANERPDRRPVVVRFRVDDVVAGAVAVPVGPPRSWRVDLGRDAKVVRLSVEPSFVPSRLGAGLDARTLGVRLHADGGMAP